MEQPNRESIREKLYIACQILDRKGLTEGFGQTSYRFPGTDEMIMSARRGPGTVKPEEMLVHDLDGNVVEGDGEPSLECALHAQLYRRRPDIQAICRTHSPMVQAFGVLGMPLRPVHGFGSFLGTVPIFMNALLIRTAQSADALSDALGDAHAVVLRGNGGLTVGQSIEEALIKSIWLEDTARIQMQARVWGEPIHLTEEEMAIRTNVGYGMWEQAFAYWKQRFVDGPSR